MNEIDLPTKEKWSTFSNHFQFYWKNEALLVIIFSSIGNIEHFQYSFSVLFVKRSHFSNYFQIYLKN